MQDGTDRKAGLAAAGWHRGRHRWRQRLAAALLVLTAFLFAATARFNGIAVPDWLWLALVVLAGLALAAEPPPPIMSWRPETVPAASSVGGDSAPPPQVVLAATTHELRTPLNAVIGFSELLRDAERTGTAPRQREEFANAILENARHLQQRLNDVLDANRITGGTLRIADHPLDMAEIIEIVSRDRHDAAAAQGVTIVARVADGITCSGDAQRLRQALGCVVDNAIAFSPQSGIVNINMLRGRSGELMVTVTDAGSGIAPEDAARAFEPFRQLDEGAARHHAGLGLGLFIARGVLRLHGGDVTLKSSPEAGTEVRLILPQSRVNWHAGRENSVPVAVAHVA